MQTARNCALVLTVFTCASGMRYVTDEDYSAHVAANIGRIFLHEIVPHPECPGEATYPGIRIRQGPPQGWINTSLGEEQRARPAIYSMARVGYSVGLSADKNQPRSSRG